MRTIKNIFYWPQNFKKCLQFLFLFPCHRLCMTKTENIQQVFSDVPRKRTNVYVFKWKLLKHDTVYQASSLKHTFHKHVSLFAFWLNQNESFFVVLKMNTNYSWTRHLWTTNNSGASWQSCNCRERINNISWHWIGQFTLITHEQLDYHVM